MIDEVKEQPQVPIPIENFKYRIPTQSETLFSRKEKEREQTEIEKEVKKWINYTDIKELGLDDTALYIISNIIRKVREQDIDWFIGIVGPEGVGKTTLALNIYATICKFAMLNVIETLNKTLIYDEDELLRFLKDLNVTDKYRPLLMDEGANILLNRESMDKKRTYILKFFNVMRFLNYIVLICTPNINFLDKNVKRHRLKSIFYVKNRGEYWYYDKDQLNRMIDMEKPSKQWNWVEPRFIGTYKVNKELSEITKQIKIEYVENFKKSVAKFMDRKSKSKY